MRLRRPALCGLLILLATAGCGLADKVGSDEDVFDSGVPPVSLEYDAPTYAAYTNRGLLVRAGDQQSVHKGVSDVGWLPGGMVLLQRGGARLFDPGANRFTGAVLPVQGLPSRSVTQINVADSGGTLTGYDLTLARTASYALPGISPDDARDDSDPEKVRSYLGATPTIGGVTFARWDAGIPWADWDDEQHDYGVLRIDGDKRDDVLVNDRIIGLYLSADGGSLLALRNLKTDPCGGCNVTQEIVEIDPDTGEIAGPYGMPEPYTKNWDVDAVDKVGDRVAVRFHESVWESAEDSQPNEELRGTWMYDGEDWSLVAGSKKELTWWQGRDDRIVARLDPSEKPTQDRLELVWVHGDKETPLPGDLAPLNDSRLAKLVPGQLLPPE